MWVLSNPHTFPTPPQRKERQSAGLNQSFCPKNDVLAPNNPFFPFAMTSLPRPTAYKSFRSAQLPQRALLSTKMDATQFMSH